MKIKIGDKISVKKIAAAKNPLCETPKMEDYVCGSDNGDISLPIEYEATGKTVLEIEIGSSICMRRDSRNGVECDGLFQSSIIEEIGGLKGEKLLVKTANSEYLVEKLK